MIACMVYYFMWTRDVPVFDTPIVFFLRLKFFEMNYHSFLHDFDLFKEPWSDKQQDNIK